MEIYNAARNHLAFFVVVAAIHWCSQWTFFFIVYNTQEIVRLSNLRRSWRLRRNFIRMGLIRLFKLSLVQSYFVCVVIDDFYRLIAQRNGFGKHRILEILKSISKSFDPSEISLLMFQRHHNLVSVQSDQPNIEVKIIRIHQPPFFRDHFDHLDIFKMNSVLDLLWLVLEENFLLVGVQ